MKKVNLVLQRRAQLSKILEAAEAIGEIMKPLIAEGRDGAQRNLSANGVEFVYQSAEGRLNAVVEHNGVFYDVQINKLKDSYQ